MLGTPLIHRACEICLAHSVPISSKLQHLLTHAHSYLRAMLYISLRKQEVRRELNKAQYIPKTPACMFFYSLGHCG